jgi:UDP-glucose 4-epimerase
MIGDGEVRVFDNLSNGSLSNLASWLDHKGFEFMHGDLHDSELLKKVVEDCNLVYHLAANPEIRLSKANTEDHFRQNVEATFNLLEAVRVSDINPVFVFTSTSTVYGDASLLPTPEDYGPLKPISIYGASKLAAESLVFAYASSYGFRCVIFRMANVVGPRSNHGVIYDFIQKLKKNNFELEVLGDGTQSKSYLYIEDCIEGMLTGVEKAGDRVDVLNIGSDDRTDVKSIAKIVIEAMGLTDVKIKYTGGVDGGRGWKGDVKFMQLDVSKLKSFGWRPKLGSVDAVRATAEKLWDIEF